ncbi:peroxiredoxin [Deinococcus aerolatus]|uniref:thioredoxin-dependent peroxiredoxin n=1 Tax=Deinococcus aerolatus TaxID=522487 RepID=A0ABQ2FYQ9_9DEIO|nr:peroxiredoxin [Deinococcus aerolatus]GGL66733.1 peroxiredoxin [Deinococcus aerolatus]
MKPAVHQAAPEFTRRSDDGRTVRLSALRGQWVVLYFFPRAGSADCSIEARRFETALPEFERLNAVVIGVSADTEAHQARFRDTCGLTHPLIPDGDRVLCRAYGVVRGLGGLLGLTARVTFLIDPQGRLAHQHRNANPAGHASAMLQELERRAGMVQAG